MGFDIVADSNNKEVMITISNITPSTLVGIRKAFYFLGKDLRRTSSDLILEKPKTGRLYRLKRNGRIVKHRASAPGEAPANFTGSLRRSIDFDVVGGDRMEFGVKSEFENRKGTPAGVDYGKYLEEGTPKMEKRPFLITSLTKNQANAKEHFDREIKKALEELS